MMKELYRLCGLRVLLRSYSSVPQVNEITKVEKEVNPGVINRDLKFISKYDSVREAWLENLDSPEEHKLGIVPLHPDVFGAMPRLDLIYNNANWQKMYKFVCYQHTKVRSEMPGGGRKPWPQKGMGRARHGSIRSPLFKGGGIIHGPRSPTTHFFMLPFYKRVLGLTSMLSVKLAQDDLHIVKDLEIPTDEPSFIEDILKTRNWGVSALFVDDTETMPRNITAATDRIKHVNLMPLFGLNVHSMLKHETLVLTLAAVEKLEEKILFQLHRADSFEKNKKFRLNQQ